MDELDRELGAYADSLRPDRQPSLDDVIASGRARRRRTAVVASALGVLAVVGVAVAVIGGHDDTTTLPIASAAPTPSPTQTPEAVYGCGTERISGIVDYINFVKANGVLMSDASTFGLSVTVRPSDLGQATYRVTCSLEQETHGTGSTEHLDNGTASFLPMGTTLSEVHGFDPRCRIAAVQNGKLVAFLASVPDAKTHQPAPCAVMPGLQLDGPATAPGDYRTAPAAYQNRPTLPDCGSEVIDAATERIASLAVACFDAAKQAGRPAEYRRIDGAGGGRVFTVSRTQHGEVERWQSGTENGQAYWRHTP
jgi:hypothetical protein